MYDFNVNIKEIDDIIVSSITRGILRERRSLKERFYLKMNDVKLLCKRFMKIIDKESNLIELDYNLFCFGSIFG